MSRLTVIPAIDLLDAKVVRLFQGDYDQATHYGDDPASVADAFLENGASIIHLVDLNAARSGDRSVNRAAIQQVVERVGERARIQVGGGIRDMDALRHYFEHGVSRCVLGTQAVRDPDLVADAVRSFGSTRVIVGVDAQDDQVRVSGWKEGSGLRVFDFVRTMERRGVQEIVYTDITRDGALTGPPIQALKDLLDATSMRIIASGGVSSLEDIRRLLEIRDPGLVGVISGRAIYDQKLSLSEALELCRSY